MARTINYELKAQKIKGQIQYVCSVRLYIITFPYNI